MRQLAMNEFDQVQARRFGPHAVRESVTRETAALRANAEAVLRRPTAQPAKPPREEIANEADMITIADVLKIINDTANDQPFVRVDQLKQALKKV